MEILIELENISDAFPAESKATMGTHITMLEVIQIDGLTLNCQSQMAYNFFIYK